MTKARSSIPRPERKGQMSIPFHAAELPTLASAGKQRAAAVELLRQMLLEAVLAESRAKEANNEQ